METTTKRRNLLLLEALIKHLRVTLENTEKLRDAKDLKEVPDSVTDLMAHNMAAAQLIVGRKFTEYKKLADKGLIEDELVVYRNYPGVKTWNVAMEILITIPWGKPIVASSATFNIESDDSSITDEQMKEYSVELMKKKHSEVFEMAAMMGVEPEMKFIKFERCE